MRRIESPYSSGSISTGSVFPLARMNIRSETQVISGSCRRVDDSRFVFLLEFTGNELHEETFKSLSKRRKKVLCPIYADFERVPRLAPSVAAGTFPPWTVPQRPCPRASSRSPVGTRRRKKLSQETRPSPLTSSLKRSNASPHR